MQSVAEEAEAGFCIAPYGEIDAFDAVLCLESKLSHLSL